MRILVFGASGATGRELVRQGLAAGHQVSAFVRNPAGFPATPGVQVIQGDVFDPEQVAAAVQGQDAVFTALGARTLGPNDLLPKSSANIIAGMKRHGVRRLIVLGAAGAYRDAGKYATPIRRFFLRLIKRTLLKYPFINSSIQQQQVEASGLDFTVVLPPRLTNGEALGKYRVEADGLPLHGNTLSRADLAEFMLKQLGDPTWVRKAPYVAY
jgi:putative NADH-flavin reductase